MLVNLEFKKVEIVDTNEHIIDANESVVKSAAKYLNDIKAPEIDNVKLLKCFKEVLKRCH